MTDDNVNWLMALWVALGVPGTIYALSKGMILEGLWMGLVLGPFSMPVLKSIHKAKMLRKQSHSDHMNAQSNKSTKDPREDNEQRQQEYARQREQNRMRQEDSRRSSEYEKKGRTTGEEANRSSEHEPQSTHPRDEQYYGRVLGLKGKITKEDVKRRYRDLVAQYHPDKVHHLGPKLRVVAEQEMKEINVAYDFFRKNYGA